MRDSLRTFTLFLVLSLGACATSRFDQHFEAGEYTAASRIFEQESALREDEDALFRAGLIYALPTSPVYDPARARALFDELIDRKSTRLNSSHVAISYAVFCLK